VAGLFSNTRLWRTLPALLAVVFSLVAFTIAINPAHGHGAVRTCEFCQTASLPFDAPALAIVLASPTQQFWVPDAESVARAFDRSLIPSHSRAPPA